MTRPRALLLSPVIPAGAGNGLAMRAGLLLTGLAKQFAVTVAVAPSPPADPGAQQFTSAVAERFELLDAPAADPAALAAALLASPAGRERAAALGPLPEICARTGPALAPQVAQLAAGVDLVVVFRLYTAPLIDLLLDDPQRPAILIDVDELDADLEAEQGHGEQARRLGRLERYYLPRADHVLTSAAADVEVLAARDSLAAVTALPNAVPVPEGEPSPPAAGSGLLFIGNLSYRPNVEGVHWFCEQVLPLLGDLTLTVAGSNPGPELVSLTADPRVTVVANPTGLAPLYGACAAAIVPLQRGGGSRLKVIEALAHSRPVVSTQVGARGHPWPGAVNPAVLLAEEPEQFAAACRSLVDDPVRAGALGGRGRELVAQSSSIEVIAARFARVAREAVLRRGVSGGPRRPLSPRPLLTAALIVRDEEAVLAECLKSLQGVADEVVIVDTGSSDNSVQLAMEHGAVVLHRPWDDDFATPRNLGLEHASGDWILYIDADERVQPLDREALALKLSASSEMALRVLLSPKLNSTPYFEYRLWRNDPRIRFIGTMHEQVLDAIHAAAAQDGRAVERWPGLALTHVGYEGDQTRKHRRNLPLLQARLAQDPSNIYNWRHLSQVLIALERPAEAEHALQMATSLAAQPAPGVEGGLAWAELVQLRHRRGEDVTELLKVGREQWPGHWLIVWIEAIVALEAGRLEQAEVGLRQLLAVDLATLPETGISYDARMFREWAHASLGLTLFRLGRNAEAADAYGQAALLAPENLEYRVKQALAQARVS